VLEEWLAVLASEDEKDSLSYAEAANERSWPASSVAETASPTADLRILFLGANSKGTQALRLDHEVREIGNSLRLGELRDRFELRQELAQTPVDLQSALLRHRPQILHFSGHGEKEGIRLEDATGQLRRVEGSAIADILGVSKSRIRCVFLNGCYSADQAQAIAQDIDCVIGLPSPIGDQAAIRFAGAFYQTLAHGSSVRMAFDLGCAQINLAGVAAEATPQLVALRRDPEEIVLTEGEA